MTEEEEANLPWVAIVLTVYGIETIKIFFVFNI